jgi:hypothetical protein
MGRDYLIVAILTDNENTDKEKKLHPDFIGHLTFLILFKAEFFMGMFGTQWNSKKLK